PAHLGDVRLRADHARPRVGPSRAALAVFPADPSRLARPPLLPGPRSESVPRRDAPVRGPPAAARRAGRRAVVVPTHPDVRLAVAASPFLVQPPNQPLEG